MTPDDIAADRAIIDAATDGPWWIEQTPDMQSAVVTGAWVSLDWGDPDASFIAAARVGWPRALDALEAAQESNDRLGAMVEWLAEVIVDARDACQRAESIEPSGSPEWVESGIAMRTTVLREVRAILDRERNTHPSALDKVTADRDEWRENALTLRGLLDNHAHNDAAMEQALRDVTVERDEARAEVERLRRGEEDGVFTSVVHECCERVEKAEAEIERLRAALALQAESVENAEAAIARVRAQHAPGEDYYEPNGGATMTRCAECDDDWPCATIRALDRVAPMRAWGSDPGEAE